MNDEAHIVDVEDVPADSTILFTVREGFDEREGLLVRSSDEGTIAAWRNYCPHWTDVRLDKGSGAERRDDELVCTRHGATFEPDSGYCTFGPCEGAVLETIEVAERDGGIYLTDDAYAFAHLGPKSNRERSSGRIGFGGN